MDTFIKRCIRKARTNTGLILWLSIATVATTTLCLLFVQSKNSMVHIREENCLSYNNDPLGRIITRTTEMMKVENPPLCPKIPPTPVGHFEPLLCALKFAEISRIVPNIRIGGLYSPPDCKARHKVAIIIPYRDRLQHLKALLLNLHPFLMMQQIDYGIYVVEQALPGKFNKGMLMNIGYLEAMKRQDYQCVIFHDVDLLPEDDRNLYSCPDQPRHLAAAVDKFDYKDPLDDPWALTFGGVIAMNRHHMTAINGFSNIYFGWGGEDNDIEWRIHFAGLNITKPNMRIGRYRMFKHPGDATNPQNPRRFKLQKTVKERMPFDGLSSLEHSLEHYVQMVEPLSTHTRIQVAIEEDAIKQSFAYTFSES